MKSATPDNFATVPDAVTRQLCEVYVRNVLDRQARALVGVATREAPARRKLPIVKVEVACQNCLQPFVRFYRGSDAAARAKANLKWCDACLLLE